MYEVIVVDTMNQYVVEAAGPYPWGDALGLCQQYQAVYEGEPVMVILRTEKKKGWVI